MDTNAVDQNIINSILALATVDKTIVGKKALELLSSATGKSPEELQYLIENNIPQDVIDKAKVAYSSGYDREWRAKILGLIRGGADIFEIKQEVLSYNVPVPLVEEKIPTEEMYQGFLKDLQVKFETGEVISGFKLTRFKYLEEVLSGFPKNGIFVPIGGKPSNAKSSYMRNLCLDLVLSNENIFVLYFTFDDSKEIMIPHFVSMLAGIDISLVRNINRCTTEEQRNVIKTAWEKFASLYERFVVVDTTDGGGTVKQIIDTLNYFKQKFPEKEFIVFIDNFHDIEFTTPAADMRVGMLTNAKLVKNIGTDFDIPVVASVELTKLKGRKPTADDIAETAKISYKGNLIMLAHNELKENREDTQVYWTEKLGGRLIKRPLIEIIIEKNKICDFIGSIYYKLHVDTFLMDEDSTYVEPEKKNKKGTYTKEGSLF